MTKHLQVVLVHNFQRLKQLHRLVKMPREVILVRTLARVLLVTMATVIKTPRTTKMKKLIHLRTRMVVGTRNQVVRATLMGVTVVILRTTT